MSQFSSFVKIWDSADDFTAALEQLSLFHLVAVNQQELYFGLFFLHKNK